MKNIKHVEQANLRSKLIKYSFIVGIIGMIGFVTSITLTYVYKDERILYLIPAAIGAAGMTLYTLFSITDMMQNISIDLRSLYILGAKVVIKETKEIGTIEEIVDDNFIINNKAYYFDDLRLLENTKELDTIKNVIIGIDKTTPATIDSFPEGGKS